jgi:shikimate dehydrogenase
MSEPQRYAVLGFPVGHSLSPRMHNAAFAALGLAATYEAIEVPPAELAATFARLRAAGVRGWNCTVPHKEQALTLVDDADAEARQAGSVNTVLNRADGRLLGFSTDGYGLVTALQEAFGGSLRGRRLALLGCGGAGRAVSFALVREGVADLLLLNRTLARAERLAAELAPLAAGPLRLRCLEPGTGAPLRAALAEVDFLVQATSLGLRRDDPLPIAPELLPATAGVFDMIYGRTPLLAATAARGCRVADGRGMLLHQGARSFTLWTGRPAPLAAMRAALAAALPPPPA